MSSALSNLVAFLKSDLEVELLPVAIGGLQILQKNPSAAGALAAEAYVLGNAPAALLAGEAALLQQGVNDLQAELAAAQAQAAATASAAAAASTAAPGAAAAKPAGS